MLSLLDWKNFRIHQCIAKASYELWGVGMPDFLAVMRPKWAMDLFRTTMSTQPSILIMCRLRGKLLESDFFFDFPRRLTPLSENSLLKMEQARKPLRLSELSQQQERELAELLYLSRRKILEGVVYWARHISLDNRRHQKEIESMVKLETGETPTFFVVDRKPHGLKQPRFAKS